jgi:hypothetical protein
MFLPLRLQRRRHPPASAGVTRYVRVGTAGPENKDGTNNRNLGTSMSHHGSVGDSSRRIKVLRPEEAGDRLDPLAPALTQFTGPPKPSGLPYSSLTGAGFERLCFKLELARGGNPILFGKTGQRDYGVDIVVDERGERTVIQCKNPSNPPTWPQIRDAIRTFERDWLDSAGLPRPCRFVYCCSQPLDSISIAQEWLQLYDEFRGRNGVELVLRGREYLDAELQRLPDVVDSVFSGIYAELFCGLDDWRSAPWIRVCRGNERHRSITRFIERHDNRRIYVADEVEQWFEDALSRSPVLLFRGLPGLGKTLTSLELATRLNHPQHQIYYASLKENPDPAPLWQSALRRCHAPACFILDDCHMDFNAAEILVQRLSPELDKPGRRTVLVVIARHVRAYDGETADGELIEKLADQDVILEFNPTLDLTRSVIECVRKDFSGLSQERVQRLHNFTGGDLMLLEEALSAISSPGEVDDFRAEELHARLYRYYFGGKRDLPTVRWLASLGQFDLLPLARCFDGWEPGEYNTAQSLVGQMFGPPRYRFLHSSLAEIVFSALASLEVPEAGRALALKRLAVDGLIKYFHLLLAEVDRGFYSLSDIIKDVQQVIGTRLKMHGAVLEAEIKAGLVSDEIVWCILEDQIETVSFHTLFVCQQILGDIGHPFESKCTELVVRKLRAILSMPDEAVGSIRNIGTGLSILRSNAPQALEQIQSEVGATGFLRLVSKQGSIVDLYDILTWVSPSFAAELLDHLNESIVDDLVGKAIALSRRPTGLGFTMHQLGKANSTLLRRLENAIGPRHFLRLIAANSTIFELFVIIREASSEFTAQLINLLDPSNVDRIIETTIESGRSIGSLNWTLRRLRMTDPALLRGLENAIGPERYLRLIHFNGTVYELFGVLQYGTPEFGAELIKHLDQPTVRHLVRKTIASRRSVGTLGFTLRHLYQTDKALLKQLEKTIGPKYFLDLFVSNGTIVDFLRLLQFGTLELVSQLLDELDEPMVERLVTRTIASGRSFGTVGLTLRRLDELDKGLLRRLEAAIGPERYHQFLTGGSLHDLCSVLTNTSPEFVKRLLALFDKNNIEQMFKRSIESGRSIESLHHTLRKLGRVQGQLERIQDLSGATRWWSLICAVGTLHSVVELGRAMTDSFRQAFVRASADVGVASWRRIILAGQYRNACTFVATEFAAYPRDAQASFREALAEAAPLLVQSASWFDLNSSRLPDSSAPEVLHLREALAERVAHAQPKDLIGLDFREAVNGFSLYWYERPDIREVLASSLRDILPPTAHWPTRNGEVAAVRFILGLARSDEVPQGTVDWLIESAHGILSDYAACEDIHTRPLYLFAWNLTALWRERGPTQSLKGAPSSRIGTVLRLVLQERVNSRGSNTAIIDQLSLAGFIVFSHPENTYAVTRIVESLTPSLAYVYQEVMELTFIPMFFALQGIALLRPFSGVFQPRICDHLLSRAAEYESAGPAIEDLCSTIREYKTRFARSKSD